MLVFAMSVFTKIRLTASASTARSVITLVLAMPLVAGMVHGATVINGSLDPFTGGDPGEGLDLTGEVIHAFNLGGPAQTIQGVTFEAASVGAPPTGISTSGTTLEIDYSSVNPGGALAANYGSTPSDNSLESLITSVWYDSNWTLELDTVPGVAYEVQLLFGEGFWLHQGTTDRDFDWTVENQFGSGQIPGVNNLVLGNETDGAAPAQPGPDFGLVYTYQFFASDHSFSIAFADNPGGDLHAILSGVVLKKVGQVPEPSTAFSILLGASLLGFARRLRFETRARQFRPPQA